MGIIEEDVSKLLDLNDESWNEDLALSMIQKANPNEDQLSIDDLTKLLLKIRALIVNYELTPCVRTIYTRVALQSSTSNRCRVTIDKDVMVINERGRKVCTSSSFWCLEDTDSIPKKDITKLPYCIYEVKIAKDDNQNPDFVTELEDSKAIVEAKKFSKFLSGASVFNADKVKTLPWWVSDANFFPLYNKCGDDNSSSAAIGCSSEGNEASSMKAARAVSLSPTIDLIPNRGMTPSTSRSSFSPTESNDQSDSNKNSASSSFVEVLKGAQPAEYDVMNRKRDSVKSSRLLRLRKRMNKKKNRVVPKTRLRVEPKSHFANERTFIQWISAALLLITLAQLFYILAAQSENAKEASIAGTWMLAVSLFIALYGMVTYYRRIYLMKTGKPYGYIDYIAPAVLTVSIISGVILLIIYTHKAQHPLDGSTMVHTSGTCIRRSLDADPGESRIGFSMKLQPSGVIVDDTKGLLLVPSNNRIIALKDGLPAEEENAEPVRVVATLEGTDIEALEYVGDFVFALSEAGKGSEVIALKWENENSDSDNLEELHRWQLSESSPEGIALIPGKKQTSPGEIIVAQNSIHVFDLDSFNFAAESVVEKSFISKRIISKGLRDPKVSSMQFFEGLLWILFDNSHVIRGLDLKTGSIVREINLPVAEVGSESQWEGMRLQRIVQSGSTYRGIRGDSKAGELNTSLVLHLTLDTPAQVWSILLNEDGQQWTLPDCAGVRI